MCPVGMFESLCAVLWEECKNMGWKFYAMVGAMATLLGLGAAIAAKILAILIYYYRG